MSLAPQVLQIMMNAQRNMKVAAWRSWNGWSEADGGLAKLRICQRLEEEYKQCKAKEVEAEALVEQKLKALNPQCRFVFGHISSRDTFWKFISPDYV